MKINNVAYAEKYLKFKTCIKWTVLRIEIKRGFVTRIFIVEYQLYNPGTPIILVQYKRMNLTKSDWLISLQGVSKTILCIQWIVHLDLRLQLAQAGAEIETIGYSVYSCKFFYLITENTDSSIEAMTILQCVSTVRTWYAPPARLLLRVSQNMRF